MSGSTSPDQSGNYGTQGTAASANVPGARVNAATWTDTSGNLWLFGGDGYDSVANVGELDDLWEYSAGQWKWLGGSVTVAQSGIYGTMGTASSGSIPGGRSQPAVWMDVSGNFWLFGGFGYDSTGAFGYLNDLWKYQP